MHQSLIIDSSQSSFSFLIVCDKNAPFAVPCFMPPQICTQAQHLRLMAKAFQLSSWESASKNWHQRQVSPLVQAAHPNCHQICNRSCRHYKNCMGKSVKLWERNPVESICAGINAMKKTSAIAFQGFSTRASLGGRKQGPFKAQHIFSTRLMEIKGTSGEKSSALQLQKGVWFLSAWARVFAGNADEGPALSAALSRVLCFLQRVQGKLPLGREQHRKARILCIQSSPDISAQYISFMNAIFSAQVKNNSSWGDSLPMPVSIFGIGLYCSSSILNQGFSLARQYWRELIFRRFPHIRLQDYFCFAL